MWITQIKDIAHKNIEPVCQVITPGYDKQLFLIAKTTQHGASLYLLNSLRNTARGRFKKRFSF